MTLPLKYDLVVGQKYVCYYYYIYIIMTAWWRWWGIFGWWRRIFIRLESP